MSAPGPAWGRGHWSDDPVLDLLPGTRDIRLPVPLTYCHAGTAYTIPAGFRSDGMTAPPWSWGLGGMPLSPRYRRPCLLHDWLCVTRPVPSIHAHHLLRAALLGEGVPRWHAWLIWRLVAWFGPRWG